MCGIAGIKRYGQTPIAEYMVRLLLTGLEKRGNDASGIALMNSKGEVHTIKNDVPAWTFVRSRVYEDFMAENIDDTQQIIVHTRASTKGSPRIAKNNHPLFAGKAAIVHNGKLENDNELFRRFDLKREAETDSDVIRAIVDKYGITKKGVDVLGNVRGSAAIAAMSPEHPGLLLVGRSGSPLTIGSTDDLFFFASVKDVIHRAMKPVLERFKIPFQVHTTNMGYGPYPDHTLWILGPNGKDFHGEFKAYIGTYHDPVRKVYVDYKERQDKWTREAETKKQPPVIAPPIKMVSLNSGETPTVVDKDLYVNCPKCNMYLVLTQEQLKMDLHRLRCPKSKGGCGTSLAEAKVCQKKAEKVN